MLSALRFVTSIAIALWGGAMILLGMAQAQLLWIPLGVVVLAVGVPMLASSPLFAERLYPTRNAAGEAR